MKILRHAGLLFFNLTVAYFEKRNIYIVVLIFFLHFGQNMKPKLITTEILTYIEK